MAGLSLQGRSERISDALILTTEELEGHQRDLAAQRFDAVEMGIDRQVDVIDKILGRIRFELGMRAAAFAEDINFDELVTVSR